jgi:hypothetical protein
VVDRVARSDDLDRIVEFGTQDPKLRTELEDALIAAKNYDGFHG